jgi:hypothetical protein
MMTWRSRRVGFGVAIVSWFFLASPFIAHAEPWDLAASLGPAFGSTFRESEQDGLGAEAAFELGLTDTLALSLGTGFAQHFIGSGEGYSLFHATGGILYKLDVLVVVPFAAVRLGYLGRFLDSSESTQGLALSVGVGFDYLWTEHFTLGFAAEYLGLLTDLSAFPAYTVFIGRIGLRLPH